MHIVTAKTKRDVQARLSLSQATEQTPNLEYGLSSYRGLYADTYNQQHQKHAELTTTSYGTSAYKRAEMQLFIELIDVEFVK